MARVIRCALVQVGSDLPMDRPVDDIKAALNDKCAGLIATAAARGARMLALPELFNTPYFATVTDPRWYAAAEPIPAGPTTGLMRELARRHEMVIVAPFYERVGAARYNSAAVVDADGRFLGVYRKHHVPTPHAGNYEPFYFHQPDVGFPVFETAYGRIGIYICYDRHFPEIARIYGVKGAEIVFNPSATGGPRSEQVWELEQQAHALANGYFVGALNRVGRGQPCDSGEYFGKSYFCGPLGEIVAQAGRGVEEVLIADLDLDEIPASRASWHTNRLYLDRRPATYHEMLAEGIPASGARKGESPVAHPQRSIHYVPIMTDEMKAAAVRALEDGRLIRSYLEKDSDGGRFEDEFCAYMGVKHGVAVSSGFAALHVAMMAAGIGPGDEVITESRTFISVGDVIVLVGARPGLRRHRSGDLEPRSGDNRGGHHAPDPRHHAGPQQRPDLRHGADRGHRPAVRAQAHRRLLPEHRHHVSRQPSRHRRRHRRLQLRPQQVDDLRRRGGHGAHRRRRARLPRPASLEPRARPALPGLPRRGAHRLQLPAERGAVGYRPRPAPPRRRLEPRAPDEHGRLPRAFGRAQPAR